MEANNINKLVNENLNYVKAAAHQYRQSGLDFDELVSEGYMAMVEAAHKFDASRGTQFAAYAGPFIRKAMEKAIERQKALYRVPKDERKFAHKTASKALSIDAPLNSGKEFTLLDVLANPDAVHADEETEFLQIKNDLMECLKVLDERERIVVEKFYGIGTSHLTLAEIAEDLNIKRERARQIRNKAVRKMAKTAKNKALKILLSK